MVDWALPKLESYFPHVHLFPSHQLGSWFLAWAFRPGRLSFPHLSFLFLIRFRGHIYVQSFHVVIWSSPPTAEHLRCQPTCHVVIMSNTCSLFLALPWVAEMRCCPLPSFLFRREGGWGETPTTTPQARQGRRTTRRHGAKRKSV